MNSEETLLALEQLAERLGVTVRYEKGDFRGDLAKIEDEKIIIVRKGDDTSKKIKTLARGIGRIDVRNIYILPELREMIEPSNSSVDRFELENGEE